MRLSSKQKGIVVAFEGIDGSGKSSIAAQLYDNLRGKGVNCCLVATRGAAHGPLVRPRRGPSYADEALRRLAALVWPGDSAERHHELGDGYWTCLAGAYFRGLEHALLPGLRAEFDVVIVENWCYKFAAKIALKGAGPEFLRQTLPLNACLDAVIVIDTPPEDAWARGGRFSFVELGGQQGYDVLGRESFIAYQGQVRARLLEFAGERWHCIDNRAGIDAACARVEALLPLPAARAGR